MSAGQKKAQASESLPEASQDVSDQLGAAGGQAQEQESMAEQSSLRSVIQQQSDSGARMEQPGQQQEKGWNRLLHRCVERRQRGKQESQPLMEGSAAVSNPSNELKVPVNPVIWEIPDVQPLWASSRGLFGPVTILDWRGLRSCG